MAGKPASPRIVWFRDDLRLSDHPALHAASSTGAPVICLYVLDETSNAQLRPLGGAARWWLAQSLRALQADLTALGSKLVLRRGAAAKVIAALARETGTEAVFWNEIAQAPHRAVAEQVAASLQAIGVAGHGFPGDLLADPLSIRNKDGRGLRVFTPFWRRVQSSGDPPKPLPAPTTLAPAPDVASERLETWRLEPSHPDWAGGLRQSWKPGESSAQARLNAFLETRGGRLFDPARPARSRRHVRTVAAFAFWRDQPAAGLACRALCRGRAACFGRRHRQVPERAGLARILPASAVRRIQTSPIATCSRPSTHFPGGTTTRRWARGSAARPAIPSSMPACASSGIPA